MPQAEEVKQKVPFPNLDTVQHASQPYVHNQISQERGIQIPGSPLGLTKLEVTEVGPVMYLISCLEASKKHLGPQPLWPSPPQLSTPIPHHSTPQHPAQTRKLTPRGGGGVIAHNQIWEPCHAHLADKDSRPQRRTLLKEAKN